MVSSKQNRNNTTNRPTANFYFLVIGFKDSHGKVRVKRTKVYTSKTDALICFRKVNLWRKTDFVSIYEIGGRTANGQPDFTTTPLRTRVRDEVITRDRG